MSSKKSKNDSRVEDPSATPAAAGPGVVSYRTPFSLKGPEYEHNGYVYRLADKADCFAFRQLADSQDGFVLRYNRKNEVLAWDKKVPGENMNMIKVFGVFANTPDNPTGGIAPEMLYNLLQDAIFREQWDTYRLEAFCIVRMNANNDIGYYAAKSPLPMVANRDFVNQRMWHNTGRGEYVIFNTSVPHGDVPNSYQSNKKNNKHGKFVRAFSKVTGYLIRPWYDPVTGEENGSSLTYISQVDPCGWIPTTITNYITTKFAPNTIKNVQLAGHQFKAWIPKQTETGRYAKDWETAPEWWIGDEDEKTTPVANLTVDAALELWAAPAGASGKKNKNLTC